MKVLILGTKMQGNASDEYYDKYVELFQSAAETAELSAVIHKAFFDDLIISVGTNEWHIYDTRNQMDLSGYSAIVLRGTGFRQYFDVLRAISSYGKHCGVRVINDYSSLYNSSKLAQAVYFVEQELPVAQTVYVTPAVFSHSNHVPIIFPCVMKAVFGAHGHDNYVVHSLQEAQGVYDANPGIRFVLQNFVPNDGDLRVLIIGNELSVIGRKAQNGNHLNNTSQGGIATLVDVATLPAAMIKDARRAASGLGMVIAGVDVIVDKETGAYYFLEVNSQPQLMSGAFVQEKTRALGNLLRQITDSRR